MDNCISRSDCAIKSEATENTLTGSEPAQGIMYSSIYPAPVYATADAYDKLGAEAESSSELTYTTLESVKLVPQTENMVRVSAAAPTAVINHPDQPIDLSLTRQIELTDLNPFSSQTQVRSAT